MRSTQPISNRAKPMPEAWSDGNARAALRHIFDAAVARADARKAILPHLPEKPRGRCIVVGAGKASGAMAAGLDGAWPDVDLTGVVVVPYGSGGQAGRIRVLEASHPVPDAASEQAAVAMFDAVRGLSADDLVIALISGGGSALLALPLEGVSLADKQALNKELLASGATIHEMNAVRKRLSAIKGGKLAAAAAPARVATLVISDVPGDDPAVVASGPTIPDTTTAAEVRDILERYRTPVPAAIQVALARDGYGAAGLRSSGDIRIVANAFLSLQAAAEAARGLGLTPVILGDAIEGESREVAAALAGIAKSVRNHDHPSGAPAVLLSGGETTVSLKGVRAGRGGRNTEFLLSFALSMGGTAGVWALAGDSDGIDGTEDAAGAVVTPTTLERGRARGLNARTFLDGHDSYSYFAEIGDLVRTGATQTNVNDIRAILVA